MMKPELLDVIELIVDVPKHNLKVGDQGTIVEQFTDTACEVEFTNDYGETLVCAAFSTDQFIVVWKNETRSWVSMCDRLTAIFDLLSGNRQEEVLNFARSLYQQQETA
ncbi:MAG: DUF4926 domain-containing protein [Cyanothece sp. SIO2G6]|nr:DUF4926 domain-containing protein [Cyanothece sp. SIO2G6]